MGILQVRILEWVAMPSFRGSSQPRSPVLQADSLPSESPGKPKNTGVGSLSLLRGSLISCHFLLQGIFPTQELNQVLLDCRWILYQLSYLGSPIVQVNQKAKRAHLVLPLPHCPYFHLQKSRLYHGWKLLHINFEWDCSHVGPWEKPEQRLIWPLVLHYCYLSPTALSAILVRL